jgi:hypothetical protein
MTTPERLADSINRSAKFTRDTSADFSDTDMLARPCKAANHTAWALGHLVHSTRNMFASSGAPMPELPRSFDEKYHGEANRNDDPSFFLKKAELFEWFDKVMAAVANFAKTRTQANLDSPASEKIRGWCPTIGHLILMTPMHLSMHTGQMQVIRRSLGKPILM